MQSLMQSFNMITGINVSKTFTKNISWKCECKCDSRKCNSNHKSNNETCQCECKNYQTCKEGYSWNPSTCICVNSKYLGSIIDNSGIRYDEIINATDSVSTNVTGTVSTNFHNKQVKYKMDCDILHTALLVIILLFIIAIICHHYAKQKMDCCTNNIKMENNELKLSVLKIVRVIILMI